MLTTGSVNVAGALMTTWVVLFTAVMAVRAGIPVPAMLRPTSLAWKLPDAESMSVDPAVPDASLTVLAPVAFSMSRTVSASIAATDDWFRCSTSPSTEVTNVRGASPGPVMPRFTHEPIPVPEIPGAVNADTPIAAASTATDRPAPL